MSPEQLAVVAKACQLSAIQQVEIAKATASNILDEIQGVLGPKFKLTPVGAEIAENATQEEIMQGVTALGGIISGLDLDAGISKLALAEMIIALEKTPNGEEIVENMVSSLNDAGVSKWTIWDGKRIVNFFAKEDRLPELRPSHYSLALRFKKHLNRAEIMKGLKWAAEGDGRFVQEAESAPDPETGKTRKANTSRVAPVADLKAYYEERAGLDTRKTKIEPASKPEPEDVVTDEDEERFIAVPDEVFTGYLYISHTGKVTRSENLLDPEELGIDPLAVIRMPAGTPVNPDGGIDETQDLPDPPEVEPPSDDDGEDEGEVVEVEAEVVEPDLPDPEEFDPENETYEEEEYEEEEEREEA